MRDEPLTIEDLGVHNEKRRLKLSGPLTITTLYELQDMVRNGPTASLVLDLTGVPYIDSAGVGALVGAYVRLQKDQHSVNLIGTNDRVRTTLKVTKVENFFEYGESAG